MYYRFEIRLKRVVFLSKGHFGTKIESLCWTHATGSYAREAMNFAENRFPGWKAIGWTMDQGDPT